MNYYFDALKKYAVFTGRTSRKEYWMFMLFNLLALIILGIADGFIPGNPTDSAGMLVNLYYLAILLPCLAAGVRRMHDLGKNGWFIIIPIYSFILTCMKGTSGNNVYGPEPKEVTK